MGIKLTLRELIFKVNGLVHFHGSDLTRIELRTILLLSTTILAFNSYNIIGLILNTEYAGWQNVLNLHLLLFEIFWIIMAVAMTIERIRGISFWLVLLLTSLQFAWGTILLGPESLHFVWFIYIPLMAPLSAPKNKTIVWMLLSFIPTIIMFGWGGYFQGNGVVHLSSEHMVYIRNYNLLMLLIMALIASPVYAYSIVAFEMLVENEHARTESLLLNILPGEVIVRLKSGPNIVADGFEKVTILFADIVDFTMLSKKLSPSDLVFVLDHIFSEFDHLAEKYRLEKIKTIGDAYMVVGGVPVADENHLHSILDMALEMNGLMNSLNFDNLEGKKLQIRIGISSGPAVAGIIGKKKFAYDLWGDAVNTASRMESHGLPGRIQVTEEIVSAMETAYDFEYRGDIEIKGKGRCQVWFLIGKKVG